MKRSFEKTIKVPKYTTNGDYIEFEEEGNETIFFEKGKHGTLKVTVIVSKDPLV